MLGLFVATLAVQTAPPSKAQLDMMDMGLAQFMHFSVDPWSSIEHNCVGTSPQCIPASVFDPTDLDSFFDTGMDNLPLNPDEEWNVISLGFPAKLMMGTICPLMATTKWATALDSDSFFDMGIAFNLCNGFAIPDFALQVSGEFVQCLLSQTHSAPFVVCWWPTQVHWKVQKHSSIMFSQDSILRR